MEVALFDQPHRRLNLLTNEWVLVSPQRAKRPWLGQVEKVIPDFRPQYDETCYLCPGNERVLGTHNPSYTGTYVFDNDFPALLSKTDGKQHDTEKRIFVSQPETGICRVVCFSPRHDLTVPELDVPAIEQVIETWREETVVLAAKESIQYVQVFENKGAMMGCSNPHPHSQIWATLHIPNEPAKEFAAQKAYFDKHQQPLLCDVFAEEQENKLRIVTRNDSFMALVPFWAVWPYEVLVLPYRQIQRLSDLSSGEVTDMADIYKKVATLYDNLFETSFPYSMGIHGAPEDGQPHAEWTLHMHFYPPLLRSATVRKFMVGYEMLATPQRDITPEMAAERLRGLSMIHYLHRDL